MERREYRLPKFNELGDEESQLQLGITRVIQACRAYKLLADAPQSFKSRLIFCAETGSDLLSDRLNGLTPTGLGPPAPAQRPASLSQNIALFVFFWCGEK
jgi:hypothetical protein